MGLFGLLGYLMRKLDFPAAALILGMVLGDGLERALRQSLMMSQGDITILVTRPISGTLLFIAVRILCLAGDRAKCAPGGSKQLSARAEGDRLPVRYLWQKFREALKMKHRDDLIIDRQSLRS